MLLSKPFVEAVVWSDLYDHDATMPQGSGLLTDAGQPKPVLKKFATLRQRLLKPLGKVVMPAKADPDS
tara:strand:- start:787 stop:990 length:204 start_codon:yes stop_codon:yes gene_type:complete